MVVVKWILTTALLAAGVIFVTLDNFWLAVVCFALAVVAGVIAAGVFRRPGVHVRRAEVSLTLLDAEGRRARFEKVQELVPVRKPLVDIRDRNLFTRGRLDDFEVSPGEVGERMSLGKYYIIKVVFKPPLPAGKAVTRRVAYTIYDGFTEDDVAFMFVGDYPTNDFILRVNFPAERLPRNERAEVKTEGRPAKPATITKSPDGTALIWRISDLRPGTQYHIRWSW